MVWFLVVGASVAAVLLFLQTPFKRLVSDILRSVKRSYFVIRSPVISDHWKEWALPKYAAIIFRASFGLLGCLAMLAAPFLVAQAAGSTINVDVLTTVVTWPGLVVSTLITACTGWCWYECRGPWSREYSIVEKLLHGLVLGVAPLREILFNLEVGQQSFTMRVKEGRHIFVSGLARSGTTVLMRSLHESGAFGSLNYADMPFVLAPRFWRKLGREVQTGEKAERAHGDGILVDHHSPEALDEPFWKTFCGESYLLKECLVGHDVPADVGRDFVRYVADILAVRGKGRYLSKNNNYVLRLEGLLEIFPNATILVPFRDPETHVTSLKTQHDRFTEIQKSDPFVRRYMKWLGHFEFGVIHRPMRFKNRKPTYKDPGSPDYWLEIWVEVYRHVLAVAEKSPRIYPVCYEALCDSTEANWRNVCWVTKIDTPAPALSRSATVPMSFEDETLWHEAKRIYKRLEKISTTRVGNLEVSGAVATRFPEG